MNTPLRSILSLAVLVGSGLSATVATAQVCEMPFEVYLTDPLGEPLDGDMPVELRFFVSEDPGALPADCRTFDATADDGWLRVDIDACGDTDPSDVCGTVAVNTLLEAAARDGDRMTIEVVLPGVDDGLTLDPRFPVGAVPYATVANRALTADTLGDLGPDDVLRVGDPIDADTFGGLDTTDFLFAGESLDADTLGGSTLADILDAIGDGGGAIDFGTTRDNSIDIAELPITMEAFSEQSFELEVLDTGEITDIDVTLRIGHDDVTELQIWVESPAGTRVDLHDASVGIDIGCIYDTTCECAGATCVEAWVGEEVSGTWVLTVRDTTVGNSATVEQFAVNYTIDSDGIRDLAGDTEISYGGAYLTHRRFGGSGADGAFFAEAGTTETLQGFRVYEFTTFEIEEGATLTATAAGAPIFVRVQGDVVIDGTIDLDGLGSPGGGGGAGARDASDRASNANGGTGGRGGGAIHFEVGGDVLIGADALLSAVGATGGAGRQGTRAQEYNSPGFPGSQGQSSPEQPGRGGAGGNQNQGGFSGVGPSQMVTTPASFYDMQLASRSPSFAYAIVGPGGGGGGGGSMTTAGRGWVYGGAGGGGGTGGMFVFHHAGFARNAGTVDVSGGDGGTGGECYGDCTGLFGPTGQTGADGVMLLTPRSW